MKFHISCIIVLAMSSGCNEMDSSQSSSPEYIKLRSNSIIEDLSAYKDTSDLLLTVYDSNLDRAQAEASQYLTITKPFQSEAALLVIAAALPSVSELDDCFASPEKIGLALHCFIVHGMLWLIYTKIDNKMLAEDTYTLLNDYKLFILLNEHLLDNIDGKFVNHRLLDNIDGESLNLRLVLNQAMQGTPEMGVFIHEWSHYYDDFPFSVTKSSD